MVLHNLLFPGAEPSDREAMFFRREGPTEYCLGDRRVFCEKGARLSLNTYYGAFSIGKWVKYTTLAHLALELRLKGSFHITLYCAERVRGQTVARALYMHTHRRGDGERCAIEIPDFSETGVYYAVLQCLEDGSAYEGGAFTTDDEAAEVRFALAICTYKREKYIARNVDQLTREILTNEASPLHGKMDIYIADNGKTLSDALDGEHVFVFPNKNAGGSGGFARAMIEIMKSDHFSGYTHIIMMDDDIVLPTETLLRNAAFLSLIQPKYERAFVGAAMLELDRPEVQHTTISNWIGKKSVAVKTNYQLSTFDDVLRNEIEEKGNHFGWWYCCMPIDVVREDNLPLPLFIKRDDVEFSLRTKPPLITLNGVCVWHESFNRKYAPYLEYYFWRNNSILSAIYRIHEDKKELRRALREYIAKKCAMLRYNDAHLAMRGVEDFLKGVEWIKGVDPAALNTSVMKDGYKCTPINKMTMTFRLNEYEKALEMRPEEGRWSRFIRELSRNGQAFKAKHKPIVPIVNADQAQLYRAKSALYYSEANENGFVVKKSFHERNKIYRRYFRLSRNIGREYAKTAAEYRARFRELTSTASWEDYFAGYWSESVSTQEKRVGINKQFFIDALKLTLIWGIRLFQKAIAFLPVKKNRITLCVYGRKGYTCNPRAVAEYILAAYPGKYELVWATQYPETCDDICKLGIRVVKYQSMAHAFSHWMSRYLVINDRVPSFFIVRRKQMLVNTWHGGINYKNIGPAKLYFANRMQSIVYRYQNPQPDLFVSGSRFFTENTARAFDFNRDVFLPSGLPRNDIFFSNCEGVAKEVRRRLKLEEDVRVVLYAPTFRDNLSAKHYGMDVERVLEALTERFGGRWTLIFRAHGFVTNTAELDLSQVRDVSEEPDIQPLLCLADVLISDYSSCFFDYCLLRRPAFSYAPDLARYQKAERGFAYSPRRWPFSVAKNNDELVVNIHMFDEESYLERVDAHMADAGSYDQGDATKRLIDAMMKES